MKNPMQSATLPRMRVGPAGQRLLDLLHRPMRGHEIAGHLDVSPQRVRQLVVRLMALGRLRVGDPNRVTLIVARPEDPSVLLSYPEERILSSLPQTEETTASFVAAALKVTRADVTKLLIPTRVKADSFRGFQTGANQTPWWRTGGSSCGQELRFAQT